MFSLYAKNMVTFFYLCSPVENNLANSKNMSHLLYNIQGGGSLFTFFNLFHPPVTEEGIWPSLCQYSNVLTYAF